jgi:hypothetical protein
VSLTSARSLPAFFFATTNQGGRLGTEPKGSVAIETTTGGPGFRHRSRLSVEDADLERCRSGTNADSIWFGTNAGGFTGVNTNVHGLYKPVTGRFDAGARADIYWYRPG